MAVCFVTVVAALGAGMILALAVLLLDWQPVLWPAVHQTVLLPGLGLAACAAQRGIGQEAITSAALRLVHNPVTDFGGGSDELPAAV